MDEETTLGTEETTPVVEPVVGEEVEEAKPEGEVAEEPVVEENKEEGEAPVV